VSAYQEGDRVRVVKPDAPAGLYEAGSTGTVTAEGKSGITVQLDHNGKTAMMFEREVERIYDDEPADTQGDEPDELTVWDRYAIAALQGLYTGNSAETCKVFDKLPDHAAWSASRMMELRRGKAS
jgi:hypothetical protein